MSEKEGAEQKTLKSSDQIGQKVDYELDLGSY
jgi:hypothetical protein